MDRPDGAAAPPGLELRVAVIAERRDWGRRTWANARRLGGVVAMGRREHVPGCRTGCGAAPKRPLLDGARRRCAAVRAGGRRAGGADRPVQGGSACRGGRRSRPLDRFRFHHVAAAPRRHRLRAAHAAAGRCRPGPRGGGSRRAIGGVLTLHLFDDASFTGLVQSMAPTFSGGYSLSGPLAGVEMGTMTLVVNGEVVAGTVRTPEATYRIRPAGGGLHAVSEVDLSRLPPWASRFPGGRGRRNVCRSDPTAGLRRRVEDRPVAGAHCAGAAVALLDRVVDGRLGAARRRDPGGDRDAPGPGAAPV